jgi:hypothetical protein
MRPPPRLDGGGFGGSRGGPSDITGLRGQPSPTGRHDGTNDQQEDEQGDGEQDHQE